MKQQIGLLFILLSTLGWAQPANRVVIPAVSTDNLPMQQIGPDDLIGISTYDSPELTRTVRVSSDGTIRLPMVRQRIKAAGLLPADLEVAIANVLKKEDILVDPVVTVSIVEYRSRPINVVGAVKAPLTFQATGHITLIDALSRAGGLSETSGPEILVSRSQPGEGNNSVLLTRRISVKNLIDDADPELNIRLDGGEEIRVPEAGRVYIVGNVKKPGAFPIKDTSETSVLKVLALTEGLSPYATKEAYIYRQEGGKSGKSEIPIELEKIMQRKSPDVPLIANDILYIPDNSKKRKTMTALDRIATFGAGTVSGVLVYGTMR